MKRYSISQLKKYDFNPAEWAGSKILGLPTSGNENAFAVGNLSEHWLCTHQDDYQILERHKGLDMEKVIKTYDTVKLNAEGLNKIEGDQQVYIEGNIGKHSLIGYIDIIQLDTIIDIKTSYYLSKETTTTMYSNLLKWDEYSLQLRFYMKATGKRKAKIVEIAKHDYKKKGKGESRQEIEFNRSDEIDKKWTARSLERLDEMSSLHNKFKY